MEIPDHLTCLLRKLYAGQEATVKTGHGTTDWFQIGNKVCQGCILSPCLFNLYAEFSSDQFSSSVVSHSLWPHELQRTRPPCPSPTPGVHPNPCSSSRWCHPTISSSVSPFSSCPQSLPASGSFQVSQLSSSGGQSIGVSASTSVIPMNTQDWFPLGWTSGIFQRRQWHPTPVLLPGKSHGRRSLVGCSPWGRWGPDTTEWLHFHFSLSCIGEGNGNPLQCACLENPRDGGAWWDAVYGVTQSQTQLKWLSSSSSGIFL